MLDTFGALTADLLTSPGRTQNTSDVSVLCTSVYFFSLLPCKTLVCKFNINLFKPTG